MHELKYPLHCVEMCFSLDATITIYQQTLADITYIDGCNGSADGALCSNFLLVFTALSGSTL